MDEPVSECVAPKSNDSNDKGNGSSYLSGIFPKLNVFSSQKSKQVDQTEQSSNVERAKKDEKAKEGESEDETYETAPYSRFGPTSKALLVFQCACTGFFSSIASAIYYPVLTIIERQFNITEEQANVTIVVYFIFQGLSPTIMGGLADSLGRRPIVLTSLIIYFGSCIGLACSQNYTQIVVLRCLQAAGIAPVIAINSGIMGDITKKAERGGYIGFTTGFIVIGFALGALIGALLANRWDWRAIFWFLSVGSGICAVGSFILMPETKRTIAGNGSVTPKKMLNKAPILAVPRVRRSLGLDRPDYETLEPPVKVDFLAPIAILKIKEISILLFVASIQYSLWTVHQTAMTTVLSKDYHLSVLQIGLCYLPTGICTLISVVGTGKYLNWVYVLKHEKYLKWFKEKEKQLMNEYNDTKKVNDLMENDPYYTFNIAEARLSSGFVTLLMGVSGFVAYGWCLSVHAPLPAILVTSGFASIFSNCILTMSTTLIVDLFPAHASTGTGCLNLFRCSFSALFIGCLKKMTEKMTYGGVFTFMGSFNMLTSLLLLLIIRRGKKLTFERKQDEKAAADNSTKEYVTQDEEK